MRTALLSLPVSLHRTTAFVIVTLAIFIVAAHTAIAAMVAQRTALSPRAKIVIPFLIAAFLASWLAIATIVADGSNFSVAPESRRLASGLVALIPFVIAVTALFASRSIRAINAATPKAWLIAIQTYRFAGIMFVFPFLTYGIVPAGVGDALTGIFAPVVALMVARKSTARFEMGGGLEHLRHARSYRRSRHGALLPGARP